MANNKPTYITIEDCEALINGITLIDDSNPNALNVATVNQIIASAEGRVVLDLSPFYADPLQTTDAQDWTNLPNASYQLLYTMFVSLSNALIIGAFVRKNIELAPRVGGFEDFYTTQYNQMLARIFEKLPNGYYKFQLRGLMVDPNFSVPRVPNGSYARSGAFGNFNERGSGLRYVLNQIQDPQKTWDTNKGAW